jgi:hypothetical protein
MRLALALLVACPSLAAARPITVGASYGFTQSKADADPNTTLAAFARIELIHRLDAGVELQDISAGDATTVIRTYTAVLGLDLGDSRRLVPRLFAMRGTTATAMPTFWRGCSGWFTGDRRVARGCQHVTFGTPLRGS